MNYSELSNRQAAYVDAVVEHAQDLGLDTNKASFSRAELRQVSMRTKGKVWIPNWITHAQSRRVERGVFNIPEIQEHALAVCPTQEPVEGDDPGDSTPEYTLVVESEEESVAVA